MRILSGCGAERRSAFHTLDKFSSIPPDDPVLSLPNLCGVINTLLHLSLNLITEPMLQLDVAVFDGGAQAFLGGAEGVAHVSGALAFALDHVGTNVNYGKRWWSAGGGGEVRGEVVKCGRRWRTC